MRPTLFVSLGSIFGALSTAEAAHLGHPGGNHKAVSLHKKNQLAKRDFSGQATWWDVEDSELACGGFNKLADFVVAMNFPQYGNPNARSQHCNKDVVITYQGRSARAKVRDACAGCKYGSLDMSPGLFKYFEPLDVGIFQFTWVFADGSDSGDDGDDGDDGGDDSTTSKAAVKTTSSKEPEPEPTTSKAPKTTSTPEPEPETTSSKPKPKPTSTSSEEEEESTTSSSRKPKPTSTEEEESTTSSKPKPSSSSSSSSSSDSESESESTSSKARITSSASLNATLSVTANSTITSTYNLNATLSSTDFSNATVTSTTVTKSRSTSASAEVTSVPQTGSTDFEGGNLNNLNQVILGFSGLLAQAALNAQSL